MSWLNQASAGNGAVASRFNSSALRRAAPEMRRWAPKRIRKLKQISFAGITAVTVCGCGQPRQQSGTFKFADVTRTNQFQLLTTAWSGVGGDLPSGLNLKVTGHLDGTAYFAFSQWDTQRVSGDVNWSIGKDWFETNCLFRYYPESVKAGGLTVSYHFH